MGASTAAYPVTQRAARDRAVWAARRTALIGFSPNGIRPRGVMASPPTISAATSNPITSPKTYTLSPPALVSQGVFRIMGGTVISGGSIFNRVKSAVIAATGGNLSDGAGGQGSCARIEVMADSIKVAFEVKRSAGRYRFLVDDQYVDVVGTLTTAATPTATDDWITLDFTSIGGRAVRKIAVEVQGDGGLRSVSVAATESCRPTDGRDLIRGAIITDSYGVSNATAAGDAFAWVMADYLGVRSMLVSGSGGTGWATANASYRFDQRITNGDLALGGAPDIVWLMGSYNDRANTPATITANCLTGLQTVRAQYPNAVIVVLGVFPANTGPSAGIIAAENAVLTAVTAFNDPLTVGVPISTDSAQVWISGTGYIGATSGTGNSDIYTDTDQTHPPTVGHAYIGKLAAAATLAAFNAAGW